MTPGILTDLPAADYHALPGASASRLRVIWKQSPAHLRAEMDTPGETTAAMMLGTLAHALILEPQKPLPKLAVAPEKFDVKGGRNTTEYKTWKAAAVAAGEIIVSIKEHATLHGMAAAVAAHPTASVILARGQSEVTLKANDRANGVPIRARLDFIPDGVEFLVDVKTTCDASPRAFAKKCWEEGYHIQAALYLDLFNALTGEARTGFKFIAVESSAPYLVAVYTMSPDFLQRGRADLYDVLATFGQCMKTGVWPGYSDSEINAPKWAKEEA